MSILSFDLDLNRIHAWSSVTGKVCYNATEIPVEALKTHDTILIEVASDVLYTDKKGEAVRRLRWAISNSLLAGRIYQLCVGLGVADRVKVSPSNLWTLGHSEEYRNQIAGVSGTNHDLRACRAMQFYYKTNPNKWCGFDRYHSGLSAKKG